MATVLVWPSVLLLEQDMDPGGEQREASQALIPRTPRRVDGRGRP
jgi:hypothetical protein